MDMTSERWHAIADKVERNGRERAQGRRRGRRLPALGLLALCAAGCGVQAGGGQSPAPAVGAETGVELPVAGVWSTYDQGGEGQYPATVWHYPGSVQEDEAGDDCDWRGGSLVDDPAERWVCVTD